MSDEKKSTNTGANTRWWESYLVRYFSGAIVGAICLMTILLYADWRLYDSAHISLLTSKQALAVPTPTGHVSAAPSASSQSLSVSVLAFVLIAGGLVYSYIISAPITVIHFGRSGRSELERHVRYFWLGWVLTLFALQLISMTVGVAVMAGSLVIWLMMFMVPLAYLLVSSEPDTCRATLDSQGRAVPAGRKAQRSKEAWRNGLSSIAWGCLLLALVMLASRGLGLQGRPAVVSLMAFALPTLFVGSMQYVTLFRIFETEIFLHRFYQKLIRARTLENSRDVRETYTHLREHSNATFIVLLELSFSAFLIFCIEVFAGHSAGGNSPGTNPVVSESMVNAVLLLLAFWMVPNLFMWSRANKLEKDFANRPLLYAARGKSELDAQSVKRVTVSRRSRG